MHGQNQASKISAQFIFSRHTQICRMMPIHFYYHHRKNIVVANEEFAIRMHAVHIEFHESQTQVFLM